MTDLLPLLQEFYREKLAMLLRHQAGARAVAQYDANNTYQYIINREETQLSWLSAAIDSISAARSPKALAPSLRSPLKRAATRGAALSEEDARDAQAFVDRWRPRVEAMANARHRGMLRVILGEMLEQKRFFEQALAGNLDLLGRRPTPSDRVSARCCRRGGSSSESW